MNQILKKKELNTNVSREEFAEDINCLFESLKLSYGMYEYWGEERFEAARARIFSELGQSPFNLETAKEILQKNFACFIRDGHFRIGFEYRESPAYSYAVRYTSFHDIPVIDCKKFFYDNEKEREELEEFSKCGVRYGGSGPLIIDLRDNAGGSSVYIYDFLAGLLGEEPGYSCKYVQKYSELFLEVIREENPDFEPAEKLETAEIKEPMLQNEKPIYVLINENSGSAAEEAIAYLKNVENVTIVGNHSAGCFVSGNCITVYLPNSHLPVHFGTGIVLYDGTRNIDEEGGFQADISYEKFVEITK